MRLLIRQSRRVKILNYIMETTNEQEENCEA